MVRVYKCLLSDDEFISDSYKMMEVKDAEGTLVRKLRENRLEVFQAGLMAMQAELSSCGSTLCLHPT